MLPLTVGIITPLPHPIRTLPAPGPELGLVPGQPRRTRRTRWGTTLVGITRRRRHIPGPSRTGMGLRRRLWIIARHDQVAGSGLGLGWRSGLWLGRSVGWRWMKG